ncbi:MAG: phosphoribosylglycinamide formyltransferase [Candidatus Omnitrophica bacterium]|nr:phosphoribosylglycinamide formyltransferase [Candidatus Omnitrophota bacterium]
MKFAVFASGNGSNFQAIDAAVKNGQIKAELALLFSNNRKAYALQRAQDAGVPTLELVPKEYANPQSFERDLVIYLKEHAIDFIVLAGYMRILTPYFVREFPGKILNIHPSLLPSFKGMNGIKDAFTYGVKTTGVTIHFVDEKMDHGPIILQESLAIREEDTLETLEVRVHELEHQLYPQAIALFSEGKLKIKGRKVHIISL